MHESDFTFAAGRVWVLENRLIDSSKVERLLDARDVDEVFRILGETEYASALGTIKDPGDLDTALNVERHRVFGLARTLFAGGPEILELYLLRFDVHNLKVLLKARMTAQPADGLMPEGVYGLDYLKRLVSEGDPEAPVVLRECLARGEEALGTGDPQTVDLAVDGAFYGYATRYAREQGWRTISAYWLASVDLTNLRTLMRCRRLKTGTAFLAGALLTGGEIPVAQFVEQYDEPETAIADWLSGHGFQEWVQKNPALLASFQNLERASNEYLLRMVIRASREEVVGPEPVFAYLLLKEREFQMIRLIVVAKLNGIPREAVRERLYHAHL